MRQVFMLLLAVALASPAPAASDTQKVANHLQEVSVTVKQGTTQGSGVIKTRTMKIDGKDTSVNFVWTAAHVVAGARSVDTVIDTRTGTERKIVKFKDVSIVQEFRQDGRRVGEYKLDAQVICYSKENDVALLRLRKSGFKTESVQFYLGKPIPPLGTDLYHVGSMAGQELGANSMTSGIVAQIGRTFDNQPYDQTTVTASPGSSGGGVFLRDGRQIGILTLGVRGGDNFNFIVPIRRVYAWAKRMKIAWAMDNGVATPTEDELKKIPVEDSGATFNGGRKGKDSGLRLKDGRALEYMIVIEKEMK